jgi:outer membrane protein
MIPNLARAAGIVVCSAAPILSQAPLRITFADAIQLALKQNLTLRQAENNLVLQQAAASQARKGLLPNFTFNTSAGDNVGQQFNLSTGNLTTRTTSSLSPGVGSNLLLFDGNRTFANIASANRNVNATALDLSRARQTAVFTVTTNFIALVGAESQRMVQKENLAAVEAQLQQVELMTNIGSRPRTDLYQQRALAASARLALAQSDQAVEIAKIDLIQSLQLDPEKNYEFVAPPISDSLSDVNFDLDSLVKVAHARRADVGAAKDRLAAAGQDARAARGGRLPSLSASFSYGTNYTSASDSGVLNQFNQRRGGGASLNFSLPVFDRGAVRLNEQRAAVAEDNARLALLNQERTAALDVRRAWITVRSAQVQIAAALAQESAAGLALDGVQERYRVGAAQLLEVTQARSQLVTAQIALSTARYNLVLTRTTLAYYTGVLDPANSNLGG